MAQKATIALLSSFVFCLFSAVPTHARAGGRESVSSALTAEQLLHVQAEVRSLLAKQVDAWNRGDLEAFLDAYWDSPNLTFFSNGRLLRGKDQIAAMMRERYKQAMGRFAVGEPQFGVTQSDVAVFWGEWHVELPNGDVRRGLGTAVVRKMNGVWRIVHDHSSYVALESAAPARPPAQ